jgi:hypothetical protein
VRAAAFGADLGAYDGATEGRNGKAPAAVGKEGGAKAGRSEAAAVGTGGQAKAGRLEAAAAAVGKEGGARGRRPEAAAGAGSAGALPMAPMVVEGHSGGHMVVIPGLPAVGPAAQSAWGPLQPRSQLQIGGFGVARSSRLPGVQSRGGAAAAVGAAARPAAGASPPSGSLRKHPRKSQKVTHVQLVDLTEESEGEGDGAADGAGRLAGAAGAAAGRDARAANRRRSTTPEPKRKRV